MKEVFISYKAEEFDEANAVRQVLEENGVSCWMAPASIPGGSSYASEIPKAIRECTVFVLVLSEQAQSSRWVPRELDQAINGGKTVLPFMLENCPLKDDFNFYLTNVQRYEAYLNKSEALSRMVAEIKAIIEAKKQGVSALKTEKTPPPPKQEQTSEGAGKERTGVARQCPKEEENCLKKPPVAEKKPPVADKTPPVAERKGQGRGKPKAKKKKTGLIAILILAAVLILSAVIAGGVALAIELHIIDQKVKICGQEYFLSDGSPEFSGVDFSAREMEKLQKFDDAFAFYFENCTFEQGALGVLELERISTLSFRSCSLTDGALAELDLENADRLIDLTLDGNGELGDLSPLSAVADGLYVLSFNDCAVKSESLSFLKDADDLYKLSADGNGYETLSFLEDVTGLTALSVRNNRLKSLEGLEKCIRLEVVHASGNGALSSLAGLENTTLLRTVSLSDCALEDASLLASSAKTLTCLDLGGNRLLNVAFLKECTALTELHLDRNAITSLADLAGLSELRTLTAEANLLTSLAGIEGCGELTYLDLSDNASLTSAAGLSMKQNERLWLDLSGCALTELTPLPDGENTHYTYLALNGNEIGDLSALNGLKGSDLVFEYSETADYNALSSCGFYDIVIIDCPLDRQVAVEESLGSYRVQLMTAEEYGASLLEQEG